MRRQTWSLKEGSVQSEAGWPSLAYKSGKWVANLGSNTNKGRPLPLYTHVKKRDNRWSSSSTLTTSYWWVRTGIITNVGNRLASVFEVHDITSSSSPLLENQYKNLILLILILQSLENVRQTNKSHKNGNVNQFPPSLNVQKIWFSGVLH